MLLLKPSGVAEFKNKKAEMMMLKLLRCEEVESKYEPKSIWSLSFRNREGEKLLTSFGVWFSG